MALHDTERVKDAGSTRVGDDFCVLFCMSRNVPEGMVMSLFLLFGWRDKTISQNTRDMYVSLSRTDTLVL